MENMVRIEVWGAGDAGGVAGYVLAGRRGGEPIDGALHRGFVRDIETGALAVRAELRAQRWKRRLIAIEHDDKCALVPKPAHDGQTKSGRAARDDRRLSFKYGSIHGASRIRSQDQASQKT
jgi:hypothetical protein